MKGKCLSHGTCAWAGACWSMASKSKAAAAAVSRFNGRDGHCWNLLAYHISMYISVYIIYQSYQILAHTIATPFSACQALASQISSVSCNLSPSTALLISSSLVLCSFQTPLSEEPSEVCVGDNSCRIIVQLLLLSSASRQKKRQIK